LLTGGIKDLFDPDAKIYNRALELLERGDYEEAKAIFEDLGDYKDSKEHLSKFYYMPTSFEYSLPGKKSTNDITYNSMNLPASEITIREDVYACAEFVYDDNGNIIKQIMINKTAETVSEYEYIYDGNGKRIAANFSAADGSRASHAFAYDNEGRLIEENYEDDAYAYNRKITYDQNGNIIKEEYIIDGVTSVYSIDVTLDDAGRVAKEVCTYPDGSLESLEYTYDKNGNCVKKVFTDYDGEKATYDYIYDIYGNVTAEIFTNPDGSIYYIKTKYVLMYVPTGITEGTELFFIDYWATRL
jgi:YD repeat-containing protein